jgi:hypothetical protein
MMSMRLGLVGHLPVVRDSIALEPKDLVTSMSLARLASLGGDIPGIGYH